MTMSIDADGPRPTIEAAENAIPWRARNVEEHLPGASSPTRVSRCHGSAAPRRCHAMLSTPPPGSTRSRPR